MMGVSATTQVSGAADSSKGLENVLNRIILYSLKKVSKNEKLMFFKGNRKNCMKWGY